MTQKLSFESLENRVVLSGNVDVFLDNGALHVEGDSQDNAIEIRQLSNGYFRFASQDGSTTINKEKYFDASPKFGDMLINLGNGDDYVYAHDATFPRDLNIDFGYDDDAADIINITTRDDLIIDTGYNSFYHESNYIGILNSQIGSPTYANNDLVVDGGRGYEFLYLYDVTVNDDLYADLTHYDHEGDEAYVNYVDVKGDSGGGLGRISAMRVDGTNFNVTGDVDLNDVGRVDLNNVRATDDIWVDARTGSNYDDEIAIDVDQLGDDFRIRANDGDDDVTVTGSFAVRIEGGSGNDTLRGGNGDDVLIGNSGNDRVYGNGGADWLEAGSRSEYYAGGSGQDWNAHRFDTAGATFDDVHQRGTPTCSFLSSLSSVALREGSEFLLDHIKYLGNFQYEVTLFNPPGLFSSQGTPAPQVVEFDGSLFSWEPAIDAQYESWVILFQRAFIQYKGLDYTNASDATNDSSAWPDEALTALTGRATRTQWSPFVNPGDIQNAVNSGENVIVATPDSTNIDDLLVKNHAYTVVSTNLSWGWFTGWTGTVTLRNPWGTDGGSGSGTTTDGLVTINVNDLMDSIQGAWYNG